MWGSTFWENGLVYCGDVATMKDQLGKSTHTKVARLEYNDYSKKLISAGNVFVSTSET